jgi:hypothetical protein
MKNNKLSVSINHKDKIILIDSVKLLQNNTEIYSIRNFSNYSDISTLTKIITQLSNTFGDYTFWWYEWGEMLDWYNVFFDELNNIFNQLNLSDKLFFVHNNLGPNTSSIARNYITTPTMLGFTYTHKFDISPRKFEKRFLSLNRIWKPHRELVRDLIVDRYLTDTFLSFVPNEVNNPKRIVLDEVDNVAYGNMKHSFTLNYQLLSFCNIVTESQHMNDVIHITEKTDKCFSAGQPFIIVAGVGYVKKLKELGFKTFDKWWDESYDEIEDLDEKINSISKVLDLIQTWSIEKCEEVYLEMIPILKHNQDLCGMYSQSIYHMSNFTRELLEIKKDKIIHF